MGEDIEHMNIIYPVALAGILLGGCTLQHSKQTNNIKALDKLCTPTES